MNVQESLKDTQKNPVLPRRVHPVNITELARKLVVHRIQPLGSYASSRRSEEGGNESIAIV